MPSKTTIILFLIILLGLYALNSFKNAYHTEEVRALEQQLQVKEKDFRKILAEKISLQDSSKYYEYLATVVGSNASYYKQKAEEERAAKEKALKILASIPKEVIDSFFYHRYADIPKSTIKLEIDKNVGNEIVLELVEKDHIERELGLKQQQTLALDSQITSLNKSLDFTKAALLQADTAISIKVQQLDLMTKSTDLLKKDLNTSKRQAFWNKWKGAGVGLAVGVVVGLLYQ